MAAFCAMPVFLPCRLGGQEPLLPAWEQRAAPGGEAPGGALIPFLPPPGEPPPVEFHFPAQPLLMETDTLQSDDIGLFLPLQRDVRRSAAPRVSFPLQELPPEVLVTLRSWPVEESSLMDPGTLIIGESRQALRRLLDFHADNARSRLCLLVLDRGQTLPPDFDPGQLAHGALLESASALIVCPLGETWRSRFYLDGWLRKNVPAHLHQEMVRDCVNDAQTTPDPARQLHRLAVRASTWLFRLEPLLPQAPEEPPHGGPMREIGSAPTEAGRDSTARFPSLWLLAAMAGLAGLAAWLKCRLPGKTGHVWLLDEHQTAPRLGGAFCGGCAATLDFAPAAKRGQA